MGARYGALLTTATYQRKSKGSKKSNAVDSIKKKRGELSYKQRLTQFNLIRQRTEGLDFFL
jgi:hypothetical protein